MEEIKVYKNAIILGIFALILCVLAVYIDSLKSEITQLRSDLKDNQVELANKKLEVERYRTKVDKQNKQIALQKSNEKLQSDKLAKWKAKPPEIKYKVIEKIREVHSNDCKKIKAQLDTIKHIDFHKLQQDATGD